MVKCPDCGTEFENADSCPTCGCPANVCQENKSEESKSQPEQNNAREESVENIFMQATIRQKIYGGAGLLSLLFGLTTWPFDYQSGIIMTEMVKGISELLIVVGIALMAQIVSSTKKTEK